VNLAAVQEAITADARRFRAGLELGQPLGRIEIQKLGLDAVFVHGTRWGADLSRGPGHYDTTSLPGLGKVTAIAGHRTTFGAPFRHIDRLEAGDLITLEMPYGTFVYRVFMHEIVDDEDWSIVRPRGFDTLVLSACHPLFSASQRWIVYARLVGVKTPAGDSYAVARDGRYTAPAS
jgi:sortase A